MGLTPWEDTDTSCSPRAALSLRGASTSGGATIEAIHRKSCAGASALGKLHAHRTRRYKSSLRHFRRAFELTCDVTIACNWTASRGLHVHVIREVTGALHQCIGASAKHTQDHRSTEGSLLLGVC